MSFPKCDFGHPKPMVKRQAEEAVKEFQAIPWTAAYLEKEDARWFFSTSLYRKPSNEDALFGKTFNSKETIGNCITVYDKPKPDAIQINEIHTLLSIGTALDGWPQILHGGVVATVIDEGMGILLNTNNEFHKAYPGRNGEELGDQRNMAQLGGGSFTATLNITYMKPVRTPNPLVITARYMKRQGRKDWIYAEIRQWDQQSGKEIVCASAEALFVANRDTRRAKI